MGQQRLRILRFYSMAAKELVAKGAGLAELYGHSGCITKDGLLVEHLEE